MDPSDIYPIKEKRPHLDYWVRLRSAMVVVLGFYVILGIVTVVSNVGQTFSITGLVMLSIIFTFSLLIVYVWRGGKLVRNYLHSVWVIATPPHKGVRRDRRNTTLLDLFNELKSIDEEGNYLSEFKYRSIVPEFLFFLIFVLLSMVCLAITAFLLSHLSSTGLGVSVDTIIQSPSQTPEFGLGAALFGSEIGVVLLIFHLLFSSAESPLSLFLIVVIPSIVAAPAIRNLSEIIERALNLVLYVTFGLIRNHLWKDKMLAEIGALIVWWFVIYLSFETIV